MEIRSRKRVAFMCLGLALVLALVSSCTKPEQASVLVYRNIGETVTLDCHMSAGGDAHTPMQNLYSRLVFHDLDGPWTDEHLVRDFATSWDIAPDFTEYTFHLRQGVQWHKGYGEVTANDVAWSFNRARDASTGSREAGHYANVADVVAVDKYTVRFILKTPEPTFLYTTFNHPRGYFMCQKAVEELGKNYSNNPIGCGPYVFESWTPGDNMVLVKNKGHWFHEGRNAPDRVVLKFVESDMVAALALVAGDIDLTGISHTETQKSLQARAGIKTQPSAGTTTWYIQFTFHKGRPQADPRVRKAMMVSIDREALADAVFFGFAEPAHSLIPPGCFGHIDDEFFPYDLELAKQLLAEAHYDGTPIEILTYTSNNAPEVVMALQAMWKKAGININLQIYERAVWTVRRRERQYDAGVLPGSQPTAEAFLYYFTGGGIPSPNNADYMGVDALKDQLLPESDTTVRAQIWRQIQEQLAVDIPITGIVYSLSSTAYREDLQLNYAPGSGTPFWLIEFVKPK